MKKTVGMCPPCPVYGGDPIMLEKPISLILFSGRITLINIRIF